MGDVSFASLQNEGGEGVYISATGDNYDASRLMMLDLVRKMPVRGDYIAMVPNRDTLVITGSDDAARNRRRAAIEAGRRITGRPSARRQWLRPGPRNCGRPHATPRHLSRAVPRRRISLRRPTPRNW